MAEKYGTIPQKFTKEWWDYFWTYYKWYVIIIAFVVITVGVSVYQKITEEKYDTTLVYSGESYYSEELTKKVKEVLSPLCEDVDKNGEHALDFIQYQLGENTVDPEYAQAMQLKLMLSLSEDEVYIYILDKQIADMYSGSQKEECAFAPLNDWLKADIGGAETYQRHDTAYGVSLKGSKLFEETGADFSDSYLFIRFYPRSDQIKKQLAGYQAAIGLANKILEY